MAKCSETMIELFHCSTEFRGFVGESSSFCYCAGAKFGEFSLLDSESRRLFFTAKFLSLGCHKLLVELFNSLFLRIVDSVGLLKVSSSVAATFFEASQSS